MDRLRIKGYLILIVVLFLIVAFVAASLNPFAWHWMSRLILVLAFVGITTFLELKFDKK